MSRPQKGPPGDSEGARTRGANADERLGTDSVTRRESPATVPQPRDSEQRPTLGGSPAADESIDRPGLEQAIDNSDPVWLNCAMSAIKALARTGCEFESYDVTLLGVPDPDAGCRWGAAFSLAQRRGLIKPVGFTVSRRPSRGGGATRTWRGVPQAREESQPRGAA